MNHEPENIFTDLDDMERKQYISALFVTLRKIGGEDVEVKADAHEVIALLKSAGYVEVVKEVL